MDVAVKVLYGKDDSEESTDPMEELIEEIKVMRYIYSFLPSFLKGKVPNQKCQYQLLPRDSTRNSEILWRVFGTGCLSCDGILCKVREIYFFFFCVFLIPPTSHANMQLPPTEEVSINC